MNKNISNRLEVVSLDPEPAEQASKGTCPICQRPTEKKWRPFCSSRCANVDLSRWLSGSYAVPVQDADEDEDGDDPSLAAAQILNSKSE